MAKKPPVTSANSRQERIKKTGKAPASTPKGRQTSAMQRPFKPGTKTSNTTGQRALPAAGQSGGSKPPKGTTTPQRGGPTRTAAQRAMERRAAAASKQAAANLKRRASNTVPKTGQGVIKAGGNFRAPGLPKGVTNAVKGATKVATNVAKSGAGKTAAKVGKNIGKGLLAKAAVPVDIALTANSIFNPKSEGNQQLAKALTAVNKRFSSNYGPRFKKSGAFKSFNEKAYASNLKGKIKTKKGADNDVDAIRKRRLAKEAIAAEKAAGRTPPKAATTPARSSVPSRSSAPARTPASRPAAKPAAKPATSANKSNYQSMYSTVKNFSGGGSSTDPTKSYGTRVNSSFSAESPSSMTKRQSLKEQTADIKKMIEASKKRQGKG
jgi:hypothetical protein